ncbi:hypothetical protein TRICI_000416 [Trichomonascus ciferrii]|uniref:F-box domain-containing protein n=1 Tax=Trichomonascus ciferrii TaxID=44093 RepID=A0A642VDG8_9ASCO|nr:hypothetical protein TRICI_000416 [Trichomonascus ciferrii]
MDRLPLDVLSRVCDLCVEDGTGLLNLRETSLRFRQAVDVVIGSYLTIMPRSCGAIFLSTDERKSWRVGREIRIHDLERNRCVLDFWLYRLKGIEVCGAIDSNAVAHFLCQLFNTIFDRLVSFDLTRKFTIKLEDLFPEYDGCVRLVQLLNQSPLNFNVQSHVCFYRKPVDLGRKFTNTTLDWMYARATEEFVDTGLPMFHGLRQLIICQLVGEGGRFNLNELFRVCEYHHTLKHITLRGFLLTWGKLPISLPHVQLFEFRHCEMSIERGRTFFIDRVSKSQGSITFETSNGLFTVFDVPSVQELIVQ